MTAIKRQVIAMGGGGFSMEPENPRLEVTPSYLSLFTPPTRDLESFILEKDIIYVGGGNTKSMLALWREWKLDELLLKAYQGGVILAGISAGANCWFQECSTDSLPGQLTMLPCLGILKGSFCPHYDGEKERRPSLHQLIGEKRMIPGYAADDGVAVHFIADELSHAVSSRPSAKAYKVSLKNGHVSEETIETRYLGG